VPRGDEPVPAGARCEQPAPPLFDAVRDTALAELGRAQTDTAATADVLSSTCASAADRRLVDGLDGCSRQRSDMR